MILLRSYLFFIAFYLNLLIVGLVGVPFLLLPKRYAFWPPRVWAFNTMCLLRLCCGTRYRTLNAQLLAEASNEQGGCLIACNHQSVWDTIIFFCLCKRPLYVLKKELTYLPILGWYILKLGCIAINRNAGMRAMKDMVKQTQKALDEGYQVIIFPEGTRVPLGASQPMHPGIWAMHQYTKQPVLAASLNAGHYWQHKSIRRLSGTITIGFTEILPHGTPRARWMAQLENAIHQHAKAP